MLANKAGELGRPGIGLGWWGRLGLLWPETRARASLGRPHIKSRRLAKGRRRHNNLGVRATIVRLGAYISKATREIKMLGYGRDEVVN